MRILPLLLRVLLTLALVANGTGSVFAATRMQVEGLAGRIAVADATASDASTGQASCDEHAAMDAQAMAAGSLHSETAGEAPASADGASNEGASDDGSPDCCQGGQCMCACMHAVGGVASVQVMQSLIDRDSTGRVLETGHATPALPHLIRPPIV